MVTFIRMVCIEAIISIPGITLQVVIRINTVDDTENFSTILDGLESGDNITLDNMLDNNVYGIPFGTINDYCTVNERKYRDIVAKIVCR